MIICPNCKQPLTNHTKYYQCPNNHSFDVAKAGYLNLLLPKNNSTNLHGDNKEMIIARKKFLDKGFFNPLSDKIYNLIKPLIDSNSTILDAGCANGYYAEKLTSICNKVIGIDISKYAISKAAKQIPTGTFIVASLADIPIQNDSIDLIINIFAPHFENEFSRILKKHGFLVKVTPATNHLQELKNILYDNPYTKDDKIYDLETFALLKSFNLEYQMMVSNDDLWALLQMTPYYYKTANDDKVKLNSINNLSITAAFIISIYQTKK